MTENDWMDERQISTKLVQNTIDRLLSVAEREVIQRWAAHKNKTKIAFALYVQNKYRYCRLVRNVMFHQQSVPIENIYVNTVLIKNKKFVTEKCFFEELLRQRIVEDERITPAVAITGDAGSGKTFLLRTAFLTLAKRELSKIPIFFDLRSLNRRKLTDFVTALLDELNSYGSKISKEQIIDGLENGMFIVIFDGFDELKSQIQDHYEQELIKFSKMYQLCPIIVSSRPLDMVTTWRDYEIYEMAIFAQKRVISLILKLDYDEKIKENFIVLIENELYESHREFLQVPLLAIIMFLTFADIGRISTYEHEFYEDAFNALWNKHDARKEGYERQHYTGLNKSDFLSLICSFSMATYAAQLFDFRDEQFVEHFELAKMVSGADVNAEDFLKDLLVSTNIFVREGNLYRYIHRSFQEYFCARYIADAADEKATKLIDKIAERYRTDNVLSLILSINEEKIEKNWVLPRLDILSDCIKRARHPDLVVRYLEIFDLFQVKNLRVDAALSSERSRFADVIREIYEFEPVWTEICASIDAYLDMGGSDLDVAEMEGLDNSDEAQENHDLELGEETPWEEEDESFLFRSEKEVIKTDLENFLNLHLKLRKKFADQNEGIDQILLS